MLIHSDKYSIFTSSKINIQHGFGTKHLVDGRDTSSFTRYLAHNGIKYSNQITPHQIHSNKVKIITEKIKVTTVPFNCDGIITRQEGVVLTILTADCVPIIFVDSVNRVIGISHQGWRGTLEILPQKMIEAMLSIGAKKEDIMCLIGPSINSCCYEIYGDRLDSFEKKFGEVAIMKVKNKTYLNLIKANYHTLISSGISSQNIDYFPFCTACNSEQFWSYQRDRGIKGEMASFVVQ